MKPSPEARDLLGYTWRERMNNWIERHWSWLSCVLILILYLVVAYFDQRDKDAGLYHRIQKQQAQIEEQRYALMLTDPAYFVIEARTPTEAATKLMAIATAADVQRIHAYNERDRSKQ